MTDDRKVHKKEKIIKNAIQKAEYFPIHSN